MLPVDLPLLLVPARELIRGPFISGPNKCILSFMWSRLLLSVLIGETLCSVLLAIKSAIGNFDVVGSQLSQHLNRSTKKPEMVLG